ncbi:MAG TPA: hypothetical protein VFG79_19730 [Solirubrobacter sp.]|nr:hypothetical protein [Solirubrobacter sp.]
MTSRALALLAAFASPVFMVAAIAGWLTGVWPANDLTFGLSAFLVIAGPVLGIAHVATAREDDEPVAVAPLVVAAPEPLLTPRAARARAFHNWRTSPNAAITRRERERRASRYLRS